METTPEKQFLLAANALYLGRMKYLFYLESLDLETRRERAREDREDYSSFQRLRDCISWDGLLDDRIEPPFQDREARAERDKRLKDLIASPADIARVTFSDIPFSEDEKQRLLSAGLEAFDTLDTLTPIARQDPGQVIRTARDIVIERLTRGVAQAQAQAQAQAGIYWQDVAAQCPEWEGKLPNRPFVQEVVGIVIAEHLSAKAAAERVVAQKGHSTKGPKYKPGTVLGATVENAVENLSRPARKVLKVLEEKGFHPT